MRSREKWSTQEENEVDEKESLVIALRSHWGQKVPCPYHRPPAAWEGDSFCDGLLLCSMEHSNHMIIGPFQFPPAWVQISRGLCRSRN